MLECTAGSEDRIGGFVLESTAGSEDRMSGVVLECTAWSKDQMNGFVLECTAWSEDLTVPMGRCTVRGARARGGNYPRARK